MSDDDQLCLLLFDELGDGVGTGADEDWLLLGLHFLALGLGFGDLLQTLLLGQWRLWAVLLQQLEQLNGILLVQGLAELVDWWWDFQALLQNGLLALNADVFRPANEARQITFWLDVLSYNE